MNIKEIKEKVLNEVGEVSMLLESLVLENEDMRDISVNIKVRKEGNTPLKDIIISVTRDW